MPNEEEFKKIAWVADNELEQYEREHKPERSQVIKNKISDHEQQSMFGKNCLNFGTKVPLKNWVQD